MDEMASPITSQQDHSIACPDRLTFSGMDASEQQIRDLQRQLEEKDQRIKVLESKISDIPVDVYEDENSRAEQAIRSVIQKLLDEVPKSNARRLEELKVINGTTDLAEGILAIVDYIQVHNAETVNRLVNQLKGHVDFLTRLSETPGLQSLFLISERTGEVLLPETARNLLIEQAARTSAFIAGFPESTETMGNVDTVLGLNVDADQRSELIAQFLATDEISADELRPLFLQEVMITSTLQRYIDRHRVTRNTSHRIDRAFHELFEVLRTVLGDPGIQFSKRLVLKLARTLARDVARAKASTGLTVDELFRSVSEAGATDWESWARRLYTGLTRLSTEATGNSALRLVIEEAALTSIGAQVLQKRLASLRLQKALMRRSNVQSSDELSFASLSRVGIACARLLRSTGALFAVPGRHKVTKHSRRPRAVENYRQ
jgi:hypothetical protein